MGMSDNTSSEGLSQKYSEFREECEAAGQALADAGAALARLESFPDPTLVQRLDRLCDDLRALHGLAAGVAARLGNRPGPIPDPDAGLNQVLGCVQAILAASEDQQARTVEVLDLLGRVARIVVRDGEVFPALASVRSRALELIERIRATGPLEESQEYIQLANGSHPFFHLIGLVEGTETSPEVREESLIEVVELGKDIARAARSRRLIIGPETATIPESESIYDAPSPGAAVQEITVSSAIPEPIQQFGGDAESGPELGDRGDGDGEGTAVETPAPVTTSASSRPERDHCRAARPPSVGWREKVAPRRPAYRPKPSPARAFLPQHPISLLNDARVSPLDGPIVPDRGSNVIEIKILPDVPSSTSTIDQPPQEEAPETESPPTQPRIEKSPPPVGDFPGQLRDFDVFRSTHWVNSAGKCEPSPWNRPDFAADLARRTADELCEGRSARLLLFARAAEALGLSPTYRSRDAEALAALLSAPLRAESGKDPDRGIRLAQAVRDGTLEDSPSWRIAVTLEAVRPSGELIPTGDIPEELVDYTGFRHEPLRRVLKDLFTLFGRGNASPLEAARSALLAKTPLTLEQRRDQLKTRREGFKQLISRHYSAGGRLKLSHCRDAWKEFMREGKEFFESLFPAPSGRDGIPDPGVIASQADRLWGRYGTIADRGGVMYGERRRMDRMVEQLLDEAEEIGELARIIRADSVAKATPVEPTLLESFAGLRDSQPPTDPTERASRRLLLMLLDEAPDPGDWKVLDVTVGDLARHPGLVTLVPVDAAAEVITAATDAEAVCPCDEVVDAITASALLLERPVASDDGTPDRAAGLRLYEALQGQPERIVRLVRLLSAPQRAAARRELDRLRDEAQERVNALKTARDALDSLVSPWAGAVGRVYQAGLQLVDDPATEEFGLAVVWLNSALEVTRGRLDAEVANLVSRVQQSDQVDARDQVLRAVAEERYGDALRTLGEAEVDVRDDGRRLRETLYRNVARERYADPRRSLVDSTDPATAELRSSWLAGINGQTDLKFRNDFLRFLCSKRSKRRTSTPLEKEARFDSRQDCRLPASAIRERIAEFGLNPCYLPQLADFAELIILVPPTLVRSADFVRKTADEVARRGKGGFCAALTPRASTAQREALLKEFRDRKLVAAVIDDLDFCRLLNPGGEPPDPLVGFVEIFLEQQRWEALSPYSNRLVEKEMFVGRLDEAGDLKRTNKYSRLFSGRKLGKTSLLNHVQQTSGDDVERLPSGNTLRVLLITSVGPDAREVVDLIRAQLAERLGYRPRRPLAGIDPGDDLVALMDGFVADRPKESLLVILDEADSLFEAELEHYETKRERCLSFRMSRDVEYKHRDSEGLPRVRFLFSGYRVTNKSEGVWVNWGDVLRLAPLWPQDADNLAAGPLARMGIDLGDQTRVVSWRSGYQPAVLLRFGRELLSHLEKTPASRRDYVRVTPEDVAQVFHRESVRDEIRTVVRYNFIPGNRLGELVFEALLLELLGVPPAAGIPEAPKRVLDRLRAIDPDTSWLQVHEASAESEIERQIADFVERQLVTARHEGDDKVLVHRLRFPHHLAVLCPNEADGDRKLREGIAAFRRGEASTAASVRSLLGPKAMEDLRYVTTRPEQPDEPARAAIVGSGWPEAIAHRSFGVPILLGFDADSTIRGDGRISQPALSARRLAVVCSGPEEVRQVLRERDPGGCRPLFAGGADLLRWAIGQAGLGGDGVDLVYYGLGRLSRASLLWWFSRVRRLGLPEPDPVGRIYAVTGGVPLLVRHFDSALLDKGIGADNTSEEDVSEEDFHNALGRCRTDLHLLARRLVSDDQSLRLSLREIQILAMAARVCRSEGKGCTAEALRYGLSEGWDDFYRADGMEEVPAVDDSADQDALALLQGLGYLPFNPNHPATYPLGRLEPPGNDDPLWPLVDLLTSGSAP
jgi:hypothetical protein